MPLRADSLWTVRGSISVPPYLAETVIGGITARLDRLKLDHVEQSARHLRWRQSFRHFTVHRDWELLGGIDSGEIGIGDDAMLRYTLRFSHVLILCLAASIFAGLFIGTDSSTVEGLRWGGLAFAWLYGFNYAVTWFQVRRLMRKAVDAAAGPSPE